MQFLTMLHTQTENYNIEDVLTQILLTYLYNTARLFRLLIMIPEGTRLRHQQKQC